MDEKSGLAGGEAKQAEAKPQKDARRKPKPGDAVLVVVAGGEPAAGTITGVRKDGTADVEFAHRGEPVVITSSPCDPEGQRPDSWRFAD